ncbi:MAG: TlpA family protein disulfide reductase [Phycisphaeraceae bacterium]|nr:TlpA family protein disulfide reductase [Phycisphaeraceae bacterium]
MTRMSQRTILNVTALALMFTTAHAAWAIDASELRSRMTDAYRQTQTYRATVTLEQTEQQGRWKLAQTLEIAYDRTSSSLRFDRPDMLLVAGGKMLRYRSDLVPGRHLEMSLGSPLDWTTLISRAPFLARQLMPDVTMLLGGDPLATVNNPRTVDPDGNGRPGLRYDTEQGTVTLRLDSDSYLVREATLEKPAAAERGRYVGPVTQTYTITISRHNEQFEQESFDFDTANSLAVSSWGTFLSGNDADATSLVGQDAPGLELRTLEGRFYRLSNDSHDVVVLCFWATHGGPACYRVLPELQQIADQAQQDKLPVSVYAVNMKEDSDEVKQVLQVKSVTLPVLMDKDGQAAQAYRVGPLPQIVIIHKGKVAQVHVGQPSDCVATIKTQIADLLKDTDAALTRN